MRAEFAVVFDKRAVHRLARPEVRRGRTVFPLAETGTEEVDSFPGTVLLLARYVV
jgi:hypothetical protein